MSYEFGSEQYDIEIEQMDGEHDADEEGGSKWDTCVKNPGHQNFIPVHLFSKDNLPEHLQNEVALQLVRAACDLTVRLRVPSRYALGNGKEVNPVGPLLFGTGRVESVVASNEPCPCIVCKISGTRKKKCWFLDVSTARHVLPRGCVRPLVDLFCDHELSHVDGTMTTVLGHKILYWHDKADVCVIRCALHDANIASYLSQQLKEMPKLQSKLASLRTSPEDGKKDIVVIASHTHGKPKHVTIGTLTSEISTTMSSTAKSFIQ